MDVENNSYHKARAIEGSEQFGESSTGSEQVAIDFELVDGGHVVTSVLAFGGKAAAISLGRLRACGWAGGATLAGISKNEVTLQAKYEEWNGETKLKWEIKDGGGGRFSFKEKLDEGRKASFMSKLNALAEGLDAQANAPADKKGYPTSWDSNGPAQASAQKPQGEPRLKL